MSYLMNSKKTAKSKRAPFPRSVLYAKEFKKDWQRLERSGRYDMNALKTVIAALILNDAPLGAEYRDHQLTGNYESFRECHIGGDFLLIYQINDEKNGIEFARAGTHADLFE